VDEDPDPKMTRSLPPARLCLAMAAAALTAALTACAGLGTPSTLRFDEEELNRQLARQFPLERRVLEVIDVELAHPRLALLPERDRLSTEFDLTADDRLFGGHAAAHLRLDYALRYEPSDHSLRLKDVRIQDLALAPDASPLHGQARRLGGLAAERLLENLPIWRMKPEQVARLDALGIEPRAITVTPRGVEVALGPKAR
jgi:hypothetical protein